MSIESCSKCSQTQRKLKITISDYEFEIKKIREDKSTDKAMYEIHLLKQVKRWQEMYQKEKGQREDQAKNWMTKHDLTVAKYQDEIAVIQQRNLVEMGEKLGAMRKESEETVVKLTTGYENKIKQLTDSYQETISKLKKETQQKITQLVSQYENRISSLTKSHKSTMDEKIRIFQSRLLGSQSQRIKQQKLHEQTRNQSKDTQAKLYHQIFVLRKEISELEGKLGEQIKDTNMKQENIDLLNANIEKLKAEHEREKKQDLRQHNRLLEQSKQDFRTKLAQMYRESIDHCSKYENAIEKMEERRESEKALYLNNLEEINNFVENRASRPEDIEQIEFLRQTLLKKTKECDSLADELRFFRLELENKEETYNKIFVPNINPSNETLVYKRKQFKLRRQGKSVTTVRQALQSINSVNNVGVDRKFPPKPKIL